MLAPERARDALGDQARGLPVLLDVSAAGRAAVRAVTVGIEWVTITSRAPARTASGSSASAATTWSTSGSTKPGWSKKCRSLSNTGARSPTSARASIRFSWYCPQPE